MTQILIPFVLGLVFGLLAGGLTIWLTSRKAKEIALANAGTNFQVEIASLNAKLASLTRENNETQGRLEKAEGKTTDLQDGINLLRAEQARLQERADRLPALEAQVDKYQGELKAQTARSATLEEQSVRLPLLEEDLRLANSVGEQLKAQVADLREKLGSAEASNQAQGARIARLEADLGDVAGKRELLLSAQDELTSKIAELTTSIEAERRGSAEKLALLGEAKEQLTTTFKSLANDILEEKTQRFTEQNKRNIGEILDPLKTKITEFQGKVEQVYVEEGKDRIALTEQVKQLMSLNQQLSQDANNLTLALKGSSKSQGNWGEMILERVLEDSGLRKDTEYLIRPSYSRGDGTRAQPDAVILLPESRNLIIDAKLSIDDYDEYARSEDETTRSSALQRHVACVRAHIKNLADQDYQNLQELKSLDFVVMFEPIEPAFIVAVANDAKLWQFAWERNILLVSPSIILFVVRTVANLWRQELQKRSVQDIVKRGAELYDKFVGFVEELAKIGERLGEAKESYDRAYARFCTGKGNVIRQADMLRNLGVKPSKLLPTELTEIAAESETSGGTALAADSA
jgi:DNA recombination protein RmuC